MKLGRWTIAALLFLTGSLAAQGAAGRSVANARMLDDPLWLLSGGRTSLAQLASLARAGGASAALTPPGCPSQIGGVVFLDLNSNGVYDGSDVALNGWKVHIRNLSTMAVKNRTSHFNPDNNLNGFYIAGGLPGGTYKVTAVRPWPHPTDVANFGHKKVVLPSCISLQVNVPIPAWSLVYSGPGHAAY